MKKIWRFLCSMKFGLILMGLVLLCGFLGSFITQGETADFYAAAFPKAHAALLAMGLNDVFNGWFFIALMALFCVNLLLCSLTRIWRMIKARDSDLIKAAREVKSAPLSAQEREAAVRALSKRGYRLALVEGQLVYHKNRLGRYGSALTHLAVLMIVLAGAAALYLPVVTDKICLPGQALCLPDGTSVAVNDFWIEDALGRLDFTSTIVVALPDGRESGPVEIKVNHPFGFGNYKFYQHTYGTAGAIAVYNEQNGAREVFTLTEPGFLSADGKNGIWFEALYPGYVRDEAGNFTLVTSTAGSYTDPVYELLIKSEGETTPVLAFPGETLTLGPLSFTMEIPVEYPGLRMKYTPFMVYPILYAAFSLLLLGLWLCFFHVPSYVVV